MLNKDILFKKVAVLFLISTFFVAPARAGVVSTCAKILRGQSVNLAGDLSRILGIYKLLPFETRLEFDLAFQSAPDPDLQKWVRFYAKFALLAFPLAALSANGYVMHVSPDLFHDHYSNTVLITTALTTEYLQIAVNHPEHRKRLLLKLALISIGLNLYWELGPLETGFERFPAQSPRLGTDWGDLISGVATSVLFVPFIKTIEALRSLADQSKDRFSLEDEDHSREAQTQ